MAHFLFRIDLEAFFASGKDFFFFGPKALPYSN